MKYGILDTKNQLFSRMRTAVSIARQGFRDEPVWACVLALVVLVPLVFNLWYIEQYDTVKYGLAVILIAAACLYTARRKAWRVSVGPRQYKVTLIAAGLFLGWSIVATVFAIDHLYAVVGFYNRLTSSLTFQCIFVALVLFIVGFTRNQRKTLMQVACSVAIVASLWSILQTIGVGYYDAFTDLVWYRAPGLLGNPNFSSMYFVVLLPFAMWFVGISKSRLARIWFALGSVFLMFAVILSSSRGALLAAVCVAVGGIGMVWIYQIHARKKLFLALCFVVLAIGLNIWFGAATRPQIWQQTAKLSDSNIQDRFAIWNVATRAIMHRPLVGTGLGNALYAFEQERGPELFTDAVYDDVHNFILQWAVTGGVPLALFGLLLIGWATYCGVRRVRAGSSQDIALLLSLGAWIVAASFTPVSVPNFLILAVILGLLLSGSEERAVPFSSPLAFLGTLGAVIVVVLALAFLAGELFSGVGVHAYRSGNYLTAEKRLTWGTRLNPTNPYALFFYAGSVLQNKRPPSRQERVVQRMANLHPAFNRTAIWLAHLHALQFYERPDSERLHLIGNDLERAVRREPNVRQHRYLRAQYYVLAQRYADAKREMLIQVAQDPKYYHGWLMLAKIYQLENNPQKFAYALMQARGMSQDTLVYKLLFITRHEPDVSKIPLDIPNLLGAL